MKLRTKFLQASLGALFLAWSFAAVPVQAQDGCDDPGQHVEAIPGPTPTPGPKHWEPGYDIGTVLDEDGRQAVDENGPVTDGRMTAPKDFTQPAVERVDPKVKVGKLLACSAEHASDPDKWTQADNDNNPCTEDPTGYENDPTTCTWTCTDGQFVHVDTEGNITVLGTTVTGLLATWQAPSTPGHCNIKCSSDDTPTAVNLPQTGDRDDKALDYSCNVTVYKLSVQFVNAEVAAGGVGNAGHQSDFHVTASDGTNGVAGVNVDVPTVTAGGLGPHDDIAASISMTNTLTGNDGVATGTFTSGSRTQDTTISVPNTVPADKSSATITQVWNSEADPWTFDPYFDFDVASPVTFQMSYSRGPIVGHSLEPVNTTMSGYVWDSTAGDDLDGDGLPDGDYVEQDLDVEEDPLTFAIWDGLSAWGPVTESNGSYTSNQTIYWDEDFVLDYVGFWFYDNNVYGSSGAEN